MLLMLNYLISVLIAIEVSASVTNTSGVTAVIVTSTADTTLGGSGETIGDASVGQTVSIARRRLID